MASLVLSGDTSGSITVAAPAVAGSTTQTLVNVTGTLAPIVSGTAQASTSGTSIDFTGIPSWVKRITVMFSGVSTNGTSPYLIQIGGSGGFEASSYAAGASTIQGTNATAVTSSTSGFILQTAAVAASTYSGTVVLTNVSSNTWVTTGAISAANGLGLFSNGTKATSTALDRVRITTVNGTDTFDAGTINILYE
jgi:hypothetical protein